MKRVMNLWSMIFILGLLSGCASTPAVDLDFTEADVDGNGFVTWSEYRDHFPKRDRKAFLQFDQNRDDQLDISEWRTGFGYSF